MSCICVYVFAPAVVTRRRLFPQPNPRSVPEKNDLAGFVQPYPRVHNPKIKHVMLRTPSSTTSSGRGRDRGGVVSVPPPHAMPEVAERVQQQKSKLTPKQQAALASYRYGGRHRGINTANRNRANQPDKRNVLSLEKQLVGRSPQRQQEIEQMIKREVAAGVSRKRSPEQQRQTFQLMGGAFVLLVMLGWLAWLGLVGVLWPFSVTPSLHRQPDTQSPFPPKLQSSLPSFFVVFHQFVPFRWLPTIHLHDRYCQPHERVLPQVG